MNYLNSTGRGSKTAYTEAIEKIELFNKYFYGVMIVSVESCIFVAVPVSFFQYFVNDMGEKSFYLFGPAWFVSIANELNRINTIKCFIVFVLSRFPFDWKTPFGFLMAIFSQMFGALFIVVIAMQVMNLVYESCWFFVAIARDLTKELAEFNKDVRPSNGNREQMTKRFCKLAQTFSDAKQ